MSTFKIASLNLNHRIHEKPISNLIFQVIENISPDYFIFTEYVHGPSRSKFIKGLSEIGLPHYLVSEVIVGQNQVFIASAHELKKGDMTPPMISESSKSNFIHAKAKNKLNIIGLRTPAYKTSKLKDQYWDYMSETIRSIADYPAIIIGDFNFDPWKSPRKAGARQFNKLLMDGFNSAPPSPENQWSFISHPQKSTGQRAYTRLDHFIVNSKIDILSSSYLPEVEGICIAGPMDTSITDHAIIEVTAHIRD